MSKHRRIVSADHTLASKSAQRRMSASRGLGAFDLSSLNLATPITPVDEKSEKIEELFKEIANENGVLTLFSLQKGIKDKSSKFNSLFGYRGVENVLRSFNVLDPTGSGEVTKEDFLTNAQYAFSPLKRKEGVRYQDYEIAEPLHYSVVPEPPPLTREFLYRAVFNEVDTSSGTKEGYITLNKLVKTMHKKRNSIKEIFGTGTEAAISAFSAMDTDGDGKIGFEQFFSQCETAFTPEMAEATEESGVVGPVVAEPIDGGSAVPEPPPMTREFLYRDVYDSIDQAQKGHISQMDFVRAMKAKSSSVRDVFGINDDANNPVLAIHVFSKLDSTGNGQVTFFEFFERIDAAFASSSSDVVEEEVEPVRTGRRGSLGR